ncbi:MAG TPA: winged helix DNA-binding domain-containing protein [Anaerolineales bacterium]|nr:winged helix DNA-binding domain-containing protein [Anaerolineales bacterium]
MKVDIPRYRLYNQFLSHTDLAKPGDVVRRLGAVQSQDYGGAKWALGLRLEHATDAALDQAFNEGRFLRTHILRPTWHFVAPEDLRWMLQLSAPRVHAANAFMYRQLDVDRASRRKSYKVLEKALGGGQYLTRNELSSAFEKAGLVAKGPRLAYFVMSAELDGILCSGPRRGKQFTYALLEERVPETAPLNHEEALAELTRRYFATRGPATLHDFTWWSGLTMADAKQGMEMVKSNFTQEVVDGNSYWFDNSISPVREPSPTAHLLPNYDEYFIGFKDRSAIGRLITPWRPDESGATLPVHVIILDGQIVGGWKRNIKKNEVVIDLTLLTELTKKQSTAVIQAAGRYRKFMGVAAEVVL